MGWSGVHLPASDETGQEFLSQGARHFSDTRRGLQRVMIDKISGKVAYAVISFGGFLGLGEDYYPLPWPSLKYNTRVDGYRVGVTEDQLKNAPKFSQSWRPTVCTIPRPCR